MSDIYAVPKEKLDAIAQAINLKRDTVGGMSIDDMPLQIGLIDGGGSGNDKWTIVQENHHQWSFKEYCGGTVPQITWSTSNQQLSGAKQVLNEPLTDKFLVRDFDGLCIARTLVNTVHNGEALPQEIGSAIYSVQFIRPVYRNWIPDIDSGNWFAERSYARATNTIYRHRTANGNGYTASSSGFFVTMPIVDIYISNFGATSSLDTYGGTADRVNIGNFGALTYKGNAAFNSADSLSLVNWDDSTVSFDYWVLKRPRKEVTTEPLSVLYASQEGQFDINRFL